MANIAQTVNVLQSVILTEGPKMVLTPTYHVFRMFKYHQGSKLLNSFLTGVEETGIGEAKVTEVTESVSEGEDGIVNITLNNLSLTEEKEVEIGFDKLSPEVVEASVVTGQMNDHNTFENSEVVVTKKLDNIETTTNGLKVVLPARSVVLVRVR